ncbi:hypothetical protein HK405_007157 [Cladochytrium tenue]|nr:hypothetical protein HK405_007157 [Cladochytrium tenue]
MPPPSQAAASASPTAAEEDVAAAASPPTAHLHFDLTPGAINRVLLFNGAFAPLHQNHLRVLAGVRRHLAALEGSDRAHVAGAFLTPVAGRRVREKLRAVQQLQALSESSQAGPSPPPTVGSHELFADSGLRLRVIAAVLRSGPVQPPLLLRSPIHDDNKREGDDSALADAAAAAASAGDIPFSTWLACDPWQALNDGYAAAAVARIRHAVTAAFEVALNAERRGRDQQPGLPPPQLCLSSIGGPDAVSRMRSPPPDFIVVAPTMDALRDVPAHLVRVVVPQADGLSSTAVRTRLLRGESVEGLVDPAALPILRDAVAAAASRSDQGTANIAELTTEEEDVTRLAVRARRPLVPQPPPRPPGSPLYRSVMSRTLVLSNSNTYAFLFWLLSPNPGPDSSTTSSSEPPPIFGPYHACPRSVPALLDFSTSLSGPIDASSRLGAGRVAPAYRMRLHTASSSSSSSAAAAETDVTVKLYDLRANSRNLKRSLQSLAREVLALSSFRSPHVARLLGFGFTPDLAFTVLELADRGNLSDALRSSSPPLSLADRVSILRQAALGFAHVAAEDAALDADDAATAETDGTAAPCGPLHARTAWLHRDVSTDNILLFREAAAQSTASGSSSSVSHHSHHLRATISDFSQSKPAGDRSRVARGACRRYAPEALADQDTYTSASDVYAFGVVVYETVHGPASFWADLPSTDAAVARTLAGRVPDWDPDALAGAFVERDAGDGAKDSDTGVGDGRTGLDLAVLLRRSYRTCIAGLAAIAADCWCADPAQRPSFLSLAARLGALEEALLLG